MGLTEKSLLGIEGVKTPKPLSASLRSEVTSHTHSYHRPPPGRYCCVSGGGIQRCRRGQQANRTVGGDSRLASAQTPRRVWAAARLDRLGLGRGVSGRWHSGRGT